ncbi:MAG: hypothetical protein COW01_05325 [Bdellovibrionales bacterium CG12_big_fil_rev_8_21_14_0_65_38_15]|nr:MAG: hypothetical protein COW79_00815 [Bdellovibrionales bacterium CG22_combo_CG10-13_8_21_14_all_38_13]PIQ56172.1 MAG: hypothetical protein COW01_05325 [Bdellovibrionales bacterium CG12_big_fil_rev_8_21_14_0_65_38_15]PIR28812.1 MAG: hypothetical protein COV38_13995 [Bdellovibrionales bacterium CG11_big_fil_rev_8_21_14_0_20_38_13]
MKALILAVTIALGLFTATTNDAQAQRRGASRDGYATRYTTTYSSWDYTFHTYYGYEESVYSSCGYYTCYEDYRPSTRVYVEETVIRNGQWAGYTRVTVYDSSRYDNSGRYVTYYTHNGRVVRRDYHRNHRYVSNRTYVRREYVSVNYVVLDEFTAGIILGTEFVRLGATVASACDPRSDSYDACMALALASSVSGSLISISASEREAERTELQRQLEAAERNRDELNIEDSFDPNF